MNCSIGQNSAIKKTAAGSLKETDCAFSNSGYVLKKGERCGMECAANQEMTYNFKVTCYVEEIDFFGYKFSTANIKWVVTLCDLASILLFIWGTMWLSYKEHHEEQELENREASVVDFSITVTGIRGFAMDPKFKDPRNPDSESQLVRVRVVCVLYDDCVVLVL